MDLLVNRQSQLVSYGAIQGVEQSKGADFAHWTNLLLFPRVAIASIRRLKILAVALEEMGGFFPEVIKLRGKSRLQLRHTFDQVCRWGFNRQVIVIRLQAPRMHHPP